MFTLYLFTLIILSVGCCRAFYLKVFLSSWLLTLANRNPSRSLFNSDLSVNFFIGSLRFINLFSPDFMNWFVFIWYVLYGLDGLC